MNFNADLKKGMFDLIKFNLIRLTFYILHAYMLTSSEFFFFFSGSSSSKRLILLLLFVC